MRDSAVNQDGYQPAGFTVPNVFAQIALLEAVYAEAGVDPLRVDYVEFVGASIRLDRLTDGASQMNRE